MPENLPAVIREYEALRFRYRKYVSRCAYNALVAAHPPVPLFEWRESGKRYVAGSRTSVITDDGERFEAVYEFVFLRNGKPISFPSIRYSYQRILARGY